MVNRPGDCIVSIADGLALNGEFIHGCTSNVFIKRSAPTQRMETPGARRQRRAKADRLMQVKAAEVRRNYRFAFCQR